MYALATGTLLASCGLEPADRAGGPSAGDFCEDVLPRVEAFLSQFAEPAGPEFGGTAVAASFADIPDGMNGFVTSDYYANQHQIFVNLMTLVRYDAQLVPEPYLARSWSTSADGTELTFELRDDVFWHDGVKTSAHDVAFTFERANDPETGFPNGTYWRYYTDVEVVDSFTVRFGLVPHAEALDPWRATPIMPKHLLEAVPATELKQHPFGSECPVGNGPFRFVEHLQDQQWSFARNPSFPEDLGGPPRLDRYVYRVVPEQTTLLTELLTGGIDVLVAARPDQADEIDSSDRVRLIHFPFRTMEFVGWNTRREPLQDARVRRALTLATNRAEMAQALLHGYGVVTNSSLAPFHWARETSIADSLPYDPDRAADMLAQAGWEDRDGDGVRESPTGTPLSLSVIYNQGNQVRADVAEIMQAQLARVGVRIVPRVLEYGTLISEITDPEARDFDGLILAWVSEFKQDDTDLFHSEKVDEPFAFAGLSSPRVDRLLDTLQVIVDREHAAPYWSEYQRVLMDEQPFTMLWFQERLDGVSRRLEEAQMDARGEWVSVQSWWIPAAERKYAADAP